MTEEQIAEVRRLLREMRRKAHPADKPAQWMIKKYERLLREELARIASQQQQSHDDEAA